MKLWGAIIVGGLWVGGAYCLPARAQCPTCGNEWPAEVIPGNSGQAADFTERRAGSSVGADIRFGISTAGLFRITQPQLVAAGLAASNVVGDQLRLFCRTQEVAITTSTGGVFAPQDYLQFYGTGHRGYYTSTNVYWLAAGGVGRRVAALDASTNAGGTLVSSHDEVVEYAPRTLYQDFYRPLEDSFDHWFAAVLSTGTAVTTTTGLTDRRIAGSNALLVLKVYGLTTYAQNPDHRTQVSINGAVQNFTYDGEDSFVFTGTLASATLNSGISTVALVQTMTGVAVDKAYLDFYQICYPRTLQVRNGYLTFCGRSGTNVYAVSGLATNEGVTVLDISDVAAPQPLTQYSFAGSGTNFTVYFRTVTTQPARYLVAAPSAVRTTEAPSRVYFRSLINTNRQADYLVITPYAFREPAYRLLKHRASNGLAVAVAPLEDVYNEFGYGIEDAAPIQQFIGYAFHHWAKPVPRYAVLMGEGTYDPRNYLGTKAAGSFLPVKFGPTPFSWSPRDNWFGAVNGADNLTDVSIGRMAGTTTNGISRIVRKTISFELASRIKTALLVADNVDTNSGYNFAADSDAYIYNRLFSAGYVADRSYLDSFSAGVIRTNLRTKINSGRHVVSFFGHGNTTLWCAEDVWNTADVASLTNSRFPIVTVFSCQNGSFEDPTTECLAEQLLEQTTNGAVAVMAPASESANVFAQKIADGFWIEFTNQTTRLGDSLNAGLLTLWQFNPNPSELWSYGILGDPALRK